VRVAPFVTKVQTGAWHNRFLNLANSASFGLRHPVPAPPRYTYRRLTAADVPHLKALLRVFGEAFDEVDTYQGAVPDDAYLARLLGQDHFIAVVAMAGEAVVGGLAAYVLDKFEQARREIYIYDLAVDAAHRRRGVATGAIRALQRIAAAQGAYVIFVQADLADAPAIALYESLGTKETAHHFDIAVDADEPRR
jgi:aminoglycoside 3-N-acetyltransferase I